jgi:hypothetical protein
METNESMPIQAADSIAPVNIDNPEDSGDNGGMPETEDFPLRPTDQRPVHKLSVHLIESYKLINKVRPYSYIQPLFKQ